MLDLDLSGLISFLVFFWSAMVFFVAGIISVVVANSRGPSKTGGVKKHPAYGFFVVAAILMVLNLAWFGVLWYLIDADVKMTYETLDAFANYVWMPLQFVIWLAASLIYNRIRK